MAEETIDKEGARAIVDEAMQSRANLAELDHKIQEKIDEIVMTAARAGRPLSKRDIKRRKQLRADQFEIQEAFKQLAFVTVARLDNSADVGDLKGRLELIDATLSDDLRRLKRIKVFAETAARASDGLARLAAVAARVIMRVGLL